MMNESAGERAQFAREQSSGNGRGAGQRIDGKQTRELLLEYSRTRDLAIRNRLVLIHTRLVHYFAHRLSAGGAASFEDLVQVGYMGLITAIERYDPENGAGFVTYASPTIAGVIKRYLRDHTWTLKVPRRLRELGISLRRVREDLEHRLGRSPTIGEIAASTGVSEERVVEAMDLERVYQPLSLDWPRKDECGADMASSWDGLGIPDPAMGAVDEKEAIRRAIEVLDDRERAIIHGRFFGESSQADIARRLGISQMHVSRLERQALRRLKALLS